MSSGAYSRDRQSPPSNTTTNSNNNTDMDHIRQMIQTPPSSRPPEFENPLEKIEQLLTCPICLDRYKQPKLLPCHHTFCLPCLDNCADIVHRTLKCPECRAEHPLPYDGVKSFQTNYTLTGFLEIHLQATDENAAQLEAYIQRYNLERCKVCDEKANLELCAHCERRACADCRTTHMEMLKRDLNRMLNQVKRLSNRITEASDGLSKGVELLTLNCETTKDEVKEYFRRYYRELKKREEMFINEIEMFHSTETRLMRNLRDVLEIESSNMSEACAYLEAALKGEREVEDAELAKFKNIFSEGLEYLRNFQPDAEELFSKKLRFSPGDDASKLPTAIANFGELTVSLPQFAGRYLPLEQSYLPKPMRIGYESDSYKYSAIARRCEVDENRAQNDARLRYTSSTSATRPSEDDVMVPSSLRYRRRQQMEEEAWNRLRANTADTSSGYGGAQPSSGGHHLGSSHHASSHHHHHHHSAATTTTNANSNTNNGIYTPGNSPWSRAVVNNGSMPTMDGNPLETTATAPKVAIGHQLADEQTTRNAADHTLGLAGAISPNVIDTVQEPDSTTTGAIGAAAGGGTVKNIGVPKEQDRLHGSDSSLNRPRTPQTVSADTGLGEPYPTAAASPVPLPSTQAGKTGLTGILQEGQIARVTKLKESESGSNDMRPSPSAASRRGANLRHQSSDDTSLNEKVETIRAEHEKRRQRNRTINDTTAQQSQVQPQAQPQVQPQLQLQPQPQPQPPPVTLTPQTLSAPAQTTTPSSEESDDSSSPPILPHPSGNRFRIICRSESNPQTAPKVIHAAASIHQTSETITPTATLQQQQSQSQPPDKATEENRLNADSEQKTEGQQVQPQVQVQQPQVQVQQQQPQVQTQQQQVQPQVQVQQPQSQPQVQGPQPQLQVQSQVQPQVQPQPQVQRPEVLPQQQADKPPRERRLSESQTPDTPPPLPIPIMHYPGDVPAWILKRRQRYQRSKTNPDLLVALSPSSLSSSTAGLLDTWSPSSTNPSVGNGTSSSASSSPSSTASGAGGGSSRVQQLLVERNNRFGSTQLPPATQQQRPNDDDGGDGGGGGGAGANGPHPDHTNYSSQSSSAIGKPGLMHSMLGDRRSRYRRRASALAAEREANDTAAAAKRGLNKILSSTSTSVSPNFLCTVDYLSKGGKPRLVFGKKGSKEGDLNWPRGIAFIHGNEFAVCDSSNHRVCVFNTQGRLIRTFGKYGTGNGQLDSAAGICTNRFRQLIVSDRYNHRIVLFDQLGQFIKAFGGHGPSNGRFNNPWGVCVDEAGMIYAVDKDNHRVQVFDSNGQFVCKFGSMGPGPGQLHNPQFIAYHKQTQHLYVTDSSNHRVCVFDHNGNAIFQFGQEGFHNGQLKFPRGIAVDDQGFIIVADSGNNRVQIFCPDGRYLHSFGTWGTGAGQMKGLEDVTLIDQTIVVSDRENHRIQLF